MDNKIMLDEMKFLIGAKAELIAERYLDNTDYSEIKVLYGEMVGMCHMFLVAAGGDPFGTYYGATLWAAKQLEKDCKTKGVDFEELRKRIF